MRCQLSFLQKTLQSLWVTIHGGKGTNSSKGSWCCNPYFTGQLIDNYCLSTLVIYKDHQRNFKRVNSDIGSPGQVSDTL